MFALRGIVVATLIGTAALIGGGPATADPIPLESPNPAPTEPVAADSLCNAHPLLILWCLITSPSA